MRILNTCFLGAVRLGPDFMSGQCAVVMVGLRRLALLAWRSVLVVQMKLGHELMGALANLAV